MKTEKKSVGIICLTFMSRRISDTSLGSAARNIKLAIFSFYPFFLCLLVL